MGVPERETVLQRASVPSKRLLSKFATSFCVHEEKQGLSFSCFCKNASGPERVPAILLMGLSPKLCQSQHICHWRGQNDCQITDCSMSYSSGRSVWKSATYDTVYPCR